MLRYYGESGGSCSINKYLLMLGSMFQMNKKEKAKVQLKYEKVFELILHFHITILKLL